VSGLFLRLARQATGQLRNPVHAALPSRYQVEPSTALVEQVEAQPGATPETPAGSPRASLRSQRLHDIDTSPELAARPRSRVDSTATPGRGQQRQSAPPPDSERADALPPLAHPQESPPAPRRDAQRVERTNDPATIPAPSAAAEGNDQHQPDDHQSLAAPTTMENIILAALPAASAPEPLLATPATAASVNRVSVEPVPAAESAAPNEVHVHIGRIEVTALAPAAAPAKRPAARQPMSLDDYLARRRQHST
jgi:hypothetical protein